MKVITEDLTTKLNTEDEQILVNSIVTKYDNYEENRNSQLSDIKFIRESGY